MATKKILVNSTPGSGNTFCRRLMARNLNATIVWKSHKVEAFREWPDAVFILRDPYDAIASAIQINIHDLSDKELEYFNNHKIYRIKENLIRNIRDYEFMLLALEEFPLVKAVTFEFLTTQPEEFLSSMCRHFNVEFSKKRLSEKDLIREMSDHEKENSRVPREKTEERKLIDKMVREYDAMPLLYAKYLKLKEIIQSTENN
jgi:hypothetical protein